MHPAPSIIFFTTASGLGYGLAALLGLGVLDPGAIGTSVAWLLALALISLGLLSSTLHLGNPRRAWRALSQWRSSWLSREGVMAILTFLPLLVSAWAVAIDNRYLPLVGLVGTACCAITVYCTAMIYASLRSVPAWHTGLTPASYLALAAAGGAMLGTFFATLGDGALRPFAALAVVLLAVAWTVKLFWRNRMLTARRQSTPETATGLGPIGAVRLFERPHATENYLTREMGFRVARRHAAKLARLSLIVGGIVPALLLLAVLIAGPGGPAILAAALAVLAFAAGVLTERWLFFAEARHVVMNYYGG
jgi:DMSO reductase anchor subunit